MTAGRPGGGRRRLPAGDALFEKGHGSLLSVAVSDAPSAGSIGTAQEPIFVKSGGLASYGVDRVDLYRRAAGYVDRVLRGEKPGELPFQQPTKYQLLLNLNAAKALGHELSPTLLALADQVIE